MGLGIIRPIYDGIIINKVHVIFGDNFLGWWKRHPSSTIPLTGFDPSLNTAGGRSFSTMPFKRNTVYTKETLDVTFCRIKETAAKHMRWLSRSLTPSKKQVGNSSKTNTVFFLVFSWPALTSESPCGTWITGSENFQSYQFIEHTDIIGNVSTYRHFLSAKRKRKRIAIDK